MMGYTHALIGAAVGMGIGIWSHQPAEQTALLGAIAGACALIPDIDHPQSTIRRQLGIVGHLALFWVGHRGITHTLLALALIAIGLWINWPSLYALALVGGWASHLVADMLTRQGLPVLWPVYRRNLHLLPYPMRIVSGGLVETLLATAVTGLLLYMVSYLLRM